MEATTVLQENANLQLIKGKRTKRQRPLSLLSLAMPNSSFSNSDHKSPTSGFTDISSCTEEEEEEDMAHCLILLARGQSGTTQEFPVSETPRIGNFNVVGGQSGNTSESEAPRLRDFKLVGGEDGLGLSSYRCKTCDRCFPSFQALGGHRASHAIKPKTEQNRASKPNPPVTATATTLTLRIPTKSKVHECMVCGVEFSSGQALGGHMRRHRTLLAPATTTATSSTSLDTAGDVFNPEFPPEAKKQRTAHLDLDLNLPAPAEEEPKFGSFGGLLPLLIIN